MRTAAGDYINWTKQVCNYELGEDNKLHTDNVYFSFDDECVALEAGKLKGGCVSTEAQWLNLIIKKNSDKI